MSLNGIFSALSSLYVPLSLVEKEFARSESMALDLRLGMIFSVQQVSLSVRMSVVVRMAANEYTPNTQINSELDKNIAR